MWARVRREQKDRESAAEKDAAPRLVIVGTRPEPQFVQVECDRRMIVTQVDYLSGGTRAAVTRRAGRWSGKSFCVPIDDAAVADVLSLGIGRNPHDGSTPIQFELHFTVGTSSRVVTLPAFVKFTYANSTNYRQVVG